MVVEAVLGSPMCTTRGRSRSPTRGAPATLNPGRSARFAFRGGTASLPPAPHPPALWRRAALASHVAMEVAADKQALPGHDALPRAGHGTVGGPHPRIRVPENATTGDEPTVCHWEEQGDLPGTSVVPADPGMGGGRRPRVEHAAGVRAPPPCCTAARGVACPGKRARGSRRVRPARQGAARLSRRKPGRRRRATRRSGGFSGW